MNGCTGPSAFATASWAIASPEKTSADGSAACTARATATPPVDGVIATTTPSAPDAASAAASTRPPGAAWRDTTVTPRRAAAAATRSARPAPYVSPSSTITMRVTPEPAMCIANDSAC